MVNKQAILDLMGELDAVLADLEKYKETITSIDAFTADRDRQHMVLHAMLVAVQSAIDIANRIISEKNLKRPDSYREVFEILKSAGVIDASLSRSLAQLAGFRNLLVHVYWKLDLKTVYNLLQADVWKTREFEQVVKDLLAGEP